jgi:hypothetical protein
MCFSENVEEYVFRLTGGVEVLDTKDESVHCEGPDSSLGMRETMSHEISVANEPSRAEPSRARDQPSRAKGLARLGLVIEIQGSARARLGIEPEISGSAWARSSRAEPDLWLGSAR